MEYRAHICKVPWNTSLFSFLNGYDLSTTPASPPGPLLGYPLQGVSALIQSVHMEPGTSPAMVSACVSRCVHKVFIGREGWNKLHLHKHCRRVKC